MTRARRYGRGTLDALGAILALTLTGCRPGILDPGDRPADPCLDGEFVYRRADCVVPDCPDCACEVTFLMHHEAEPNAEPPPALINGEVSVIGFRTGTAAPWETLSFTGRVSAVGEATGNLVVNFADARESDADGQVVLRLSDIAEDCPDRLDFEAFTYTDPTASPERVVTERYTATRVAPCTRRRPSCE
jgi:hypothetical protein